MSDARLVALGIDIHECQALHRLWSQIAPNDLTSRDYRMIEQSVVYGAGWFAPDDNDPRWSHGAMIERDNERAYAMKEMR